MVDERALTGSCLFGYEYGYDADGLEPKTKFALKIYEIFSPMISGGGGCGCTGLDASEASI